MKRRHQVQITIKEAEIISGAVFWYMQYINYRDMLHCREVYDKFTRVYQILKFYQTLEDGNKTKLHNDDSES